MTDIAYPPLTAAEIAWIEAARSATVTVELTTDGCVSFRLPQSLVDEFLEQVPATLPVHLSFTALEGELSLSLRSLPRPASR